MESRSHTIPLVGVTQSLSRSHTIPLLGVTQFPFEISLINLILPTFPHILRKFKTYFWWNTPCLAMNQYGIAKCLIVT